MGGAGSAVNEFFISKRLATSLLNIGLPDRFISHGSPKILLADCGLDTNGIVRTIQEEKIRLEQVLI
jgi:1-deoxy-D-xylulose-5-phosphate synthase